MVLLNMPRAQGTVKYELDKSDLLTSYEGYVVIFDDVSSLFCCKAPREPYNVLSVCSSVACCTVSFDFLHKGKLRHY